METAKRLSPRPDHVPEELVFDYDLYEPPHEIDSDIQVKIARELHSGPDIIWTPRNGGHWVFTRAEDIDQGQRNGALFSMREITVPKGTTPFLNIPLETDDPEHLAYRAALQPSFAPAEILKLEREIRELTIELIEAFLARGECEFVTEFAAILPIVIFMNLARLPAKDKDDLMAWSDAAVHPTSFENRQWGYGSMASYIEKLMADRADNGEEDVISQIMRGRVFDRDMTYQERHSMILNALLGGLDTVMSTMGFIASFLARHPDHRRQLIDDPTMIPKAVDELMRYHGATGTARVVTEDVVYKGVQFKEGDRVLIQSMLHGQDPRRFPNPETVDFTRKDVRHATFGQGTHRCIGALLARLEMRIFIEEWLKRIPDFRLAEGKAPIVERGMVNSMRSLWLQWPVPAA